MSGSIETAAGIEHRETPISITQLPDAVLHPDFTKYYQDSLRNPEHPNGWGNAVLLLDMLLKLESTRPPEAIVVAEYQSALKDPDSVDKPRLYKESLARAVVDLAQLAGIDIEVITAQNLDRINGRIKWTSFESRLDRDRIRSILGDTMLPTSLTSINQSPEVIDRSGTDHHSRRLSSLWNMLHHGDDLVTTHESGENASIIKIGITTPLIPESTFETNQILLLPNDFTLKPSRR